MPQLKTGLRHVSRMLATGATALVLSSVAASAQQSGTVATSEAGATQATTDGWSASTRRYETRPFDGAFGEALRRLFRDVSGSSCFAGVQGSQLELAFIGILPQNVAFHDSLRDRINQRARTVIQERLFLGPRLIDPGTLGTIAQMTDLNVLDRKQLAQTIERTTNAPFVLVINATRPALDVGMLRIEFFARNAEGVAACPKSETVFIELSTLKVIPPSVASAVSSGNYVAGIHAYRHALHESRNLLTSFERLRVAVETNLVGSCRLLANAERRFRSDYFSVSDVRTDNVGNVGDAWPTLQAPGSDEAAAVDDPRVGQLRLTLQRLGDEPGVMDAEVEIRRGNEQIALRYFRMVVSPRALAGCRVRQDDPLGALLAETVRGTSALTVIPRLPAFRVNRDSMELELNLAADRYGYCWVVGSDMEAYVVYPWRKEQLAKPWSARSSLTYPTGFRYANQSLPRQIYNQAGTELFGCFTSAQRLPQEVEAAWLAAHGNARHARGAKPYLTADEVDKLRQTMRKVPGIEEVYTRITVVE